MARAAQQAGEGASPQADDDLQPLLEVDDDMQILASNDEWAFRRADRLTEKSRDRRGDSDRKTEGEVFDKPTLLTLHNFLLHGALKSLDFPISTGKEANVFRGTTPRGGYVAVKIFRVNTSTFKHVLQYIQGDERFEGISGDKRAMVHAWAHKEHRNLVRAREAGVPVPEPIKVLNNVLIMEYLGIKQGPWPTLKDAKEYDPQVLWEQVRDDYIALYNKADLIHADLSEYNLMLEGHSVKPLDEQRARMIDIGQAVLKNHPMANDFLTRDVRNITAFFRRKGVDAKPEHILSKLRHERATSKERFDGTTMEAGEERTPRAKPVAGTPKKPGKPARAKRRKPAPDAAEAA